MNADALAAGLAALREGVGGSVSLEVVGLVPGRSDLDQRRTVAEVRVLVTADSPDAVVEALLGLQGHGGLHRLEPVPDSLWQPLGRPPQAAFLALVPVQGELALAEPAIVRHPLEVRHVPVPRPDAARRP